MQGNISPYSTPTTPVHIPHRQHPSIFCTDNTSPYSATPVYILHQPTPVYILHQPTSVCIRYQLTPVCILHQPKSVYILHPPTSVSCTSPYQSISCTSQHLYLAPAQIILYPAPANIRQLRNSPVRCWLHHRERASSMATQNIFILLVPVY